MNKTVIDQLLPASKRWIAKKIEEFEALKFKFGSPELDEIRRQIVIITTMIRSEVPYLTDKQCTQMLWYIYQTYKKGNDEE